MLIGTKSIKAVNTNDYSLNIDLGFAINSLEIISFLNKNNIPYYEADKKKNKSEES